MTKKGPQRPERERRSPNRNAAQIEDLLGRGMSFPDIIANFEELESGWPFVMPEAKAEVIATFVDENEWDVDQIVKTFPELASGVEPYSNLVAAKTSAAERRPRGGGSMAGKGPELSRIS